MGTVPLEQAWAQVREALLDPDGLVRAVGSGRRRGSQPRWRRVELRYVDLKAGRHLQTTAYDDTQAHTANHRVGAEAATAVDALLAEPLANWHLETTAGTTQARVTKRGEGLVHTSGRGDRAAASPEVDRSHDRDKQRLLPPDDPEVALLLRTLDLADEQGRIKPSRQAKYRQVEEFCRILDASITEALATGRLRRPTEDAPLRVVDLGCGNAYLTFTAQRYLTTVRGLPVEVTGVDVKEQSRDHNAAVAARLGLGSRFVVGGIADAVLPDAAGEPEVVLALHACDTATDEALARALAWRAPLVLAAPCCHHDLAAQLRRTPPPAPYAQLTRHGILRERTADTLTDALRASLVRARGYRVEVMQFVESRHTPRNTLLRAVLAGRGAADGRGDADGDAARAAREEYDALVTAWGLSPRLGQLLGHEPTPAP